LGVCALPAPGPLDSCSLGRSASRACAGPGTAAGSLLLRMAVLKSSPQVSGTDLVGCRAPAPAPASLYAGFGRNDASRKAGALPNALELRRRIRLAALSADPRRHTLIVGAGDICRPEVARRAARVGAFPSHGRKHMMTHPSRSDAVSSGAVSLPNSVAMARRIRPYMRWPASWPKRWARMTRPGPIQMESDHRSATCRAWLVPAGPACVTLAA
jgi:hypothetical protein